MRFQGDKGHGATSDVEQAVVCSAAAIHKSERNSMDFNPNVKFQVG